MSTSSRSFRASLGGDHVALPCNLSDGAAVDALVPQAVEALGGKLDILVNNAGITRDNLAMRMKDEEFDEVIRVNLEAAFRLMRAAAKPMMKARFGRIISVTSVVGVTGNPGQANYVASKAGLIGMSKAIAQELASRGITVNCIAPGFMTSAMTDALNDQQRDGILSRIPMGAMGSGEDIGAAAVYLAAEGGRLRHRADAARQRRDGDAVTPRGRRSRRRSRRVSEAEREESELPASDAREQRRDPDQGQQRSFPTTASRGARPSSHRKPMRRQQHDKIIVEHIGRRDQHGGA